ncbi:MAG: Cna B-type domain-containing protein, partial [Methanobrevibacter sp.]|nr:Cna B-type domain-containing protein [Methanobrevibacter sp.]
MKLNKTHIILLFALIMTLFLCAGSAFAYEVDDMQIMDKNVQLSSSDDGGDNGVQSNIFDTNLKSDVESSNLKLGENSNDLMDSSINAKSGAQSQSTLGDSADDSQSNDLEDFEIYQHSGAITYVFDKDTEISSETYRAIGIWSNGIFQGSGIPYLMNDTTWTVCLDGDASDPDGSGMYPPGIYRRITLSDKDKFINKYTGEDVYKYLRTYLYLNYNKNITGYHDNGKVVLSDYLIWAFMERNYTNPNDYYNTRIFGGKEVYEYVKEIIDIVDSGNGVNSSGPFNNSDFLTYQFYLYGADLEENHGGYQALLGFNILTKINVTKVWDDNDNSQGTRPDSISVQLYGNNETIGKAVVLDEGNNWTYAFKDLPVYYLYNMSFKLNKEDFSVEATYEEGKACDVTVRKIWDESYTGEKPENIVIYLYANGRYRDEVELSEADNWEYTFKVLNKYDRNGNEITYTAKDKTSGSIGQVETTVKDAKIKNLHFQIINDDLKNESWYIEIRDTAIAGA